MAQPQLLQIKLSRFDAQPWGFRLQGGVDFAAPLLVQKVNGGSLAEQAGLEPGDAVIRINDVDVFNLTHKAAQDIVVRSGNTFVMTIQRGGSTWRPHVTPTGNLPQPSSPYLQTVTKTSLAHKQQESQHIGCGYNNAARPFANGGDGNVKSIVNKQYNTPVGIYSDESIAETLSAQAEVLAGGVLGVNFKKNEREYQADKSEVLKFLREEETGQTLSPTPDPHSATNFYSTQSHAIGGSGRRTPQPHHFQQQQQPQMPPPAPKPAAVKKPMTPTPAESSANIPADPRVIVVPICPALQGPEYAKEIQTADDNERKPLSASGHPACSLCGVSIVGVFVRIKDRNLHVECFKCATCGTSLKNQGYYNFNNKLYCEIHAKLAALQHPPPGTEGYVPVPIKPNTKLSASTVSAALNAHGYKNGVSNGSTTPTPSASVQSPLASTSVVASASVSASASATASAITTATNSVTTQVSALPKTIPPPPPPLPSLPIPSSPQTNFSETLVEQKIDNSSSASNLISQCISSGSNINSNKMSSLIDDQPIYGQINGGSLNNNNATLANQSMSNEQDKPFEYVTLTGNVIRSVVPPGKGVNINYKVNQGYARPFGASAASPAAAPKSPISYPPQQWSQPSSNPYATLPRTNVGQQEPNTNTQTNLQTHTKPSNAGNTNINVNNFNATLPRKPSLSKMTYHSPADLHNTESDEINATAMLTESIGKLEMGNKMNNFMSEAGKIISNMLEARLANNLVQNPNMKHSPGSLPSMSHSGSTQNLQNIGNSNTNLACRSPMVVRKRLDLEDFKNIDPTQPVHLQPVIAVQQQQNETNFKTNSQKAQPQIPKGSVNNTKMMTSNMPLDHPMSKLLDICDNKTTAAIASTTTPKAINAASIPNVTNNNKPNFTTNIERKEKKPLSSPTQEENDLPMAYKPVVYRNKDSSGDTNRSGRSIHAFDRRSYIEPQNPQNEETNKDGPVFSISVKALGGPNADPNLPMAPENEEVVSQLLKDGKKPICCQCDKEITSGPFITALGRIWCPDHFICVNGNCRRPLQDIGFVEEKGDLYCEYCFEKYLAPTCSKCCGKIKGDCLNAIGRHFHPECFNCAHCGKLFGNTPFFLEDGNPYCEADWNELFTTKCFACGFPVEAGDRWVEALNHNYHSQCFNCTFCKQNLEGQSFYNKGGRPFCKNHAR